MSDFAPPAAPAGPSYLETQALNRASEGIGAGRDSRLSRRLFEHYKRMGGKGGKIRCGETGKDYLDAYSANDVDRFERQLAGNSFEVSEWIDWSLRFLVTPTVGSSPLSVASYAFQSFFIDVSEHGSNEGLFNRIVAELSQVTFEFLVSILSIEIKGIDSEDALREGFVAISNARNSGISDALLNQVDNYFDVAVDAIRLAAEDGKIGRGRITGDGIEGLAKAFGTALAKELKNTSAERKEKMLHDPVEVFNFYNELLKKSGMKFQLPKDEAILALENKRDELLRLKEENAALKRHGVDAKGGDGASTSAGNASLPEVRKEAKNRGWFKSLFGEAGRG